MIVLAWYWWIILGLGCFAVLLLGPLLFGRLLVPGMTLALFRRFGWIMARLLDRISPGLDLRILVKAGNQYFKKTFAATPFKDRVLFLPFCLRPLDCPAEVDPEVGLCCIGDCPDCQVGQIRAEALDLGYGAVYVVPSSRIMRGRGLLPSDQFIKSKIKAHAPGAALGVTCPWHLRNRLLTKHTLRRGQYAAVGDKGQGSKVKSALQGVLMEGRDCRNGVVNWARVRQYLNLKS